MHGPPERILLFRSGRHLQVALDALRADSPGCEVTVVATSSAAAVLDRCGIGPANRVTYDRTPFFRPLPFLTSAAGARAVAGRFDRVCVLWNDPGGVGQANVDYTAMVVSPGGFTAITPDGTLVMRHTAATLARAARRAVVSAAVGAFLGLALWLPARLWTAGYVVLRSRRPV